MTNGGNHRVTQLSNFCAMQGSVIQTPANLIRCLWDRRWFREYNFTVAWIRYVRSPLMAFSDDLVCYFSAYQGRSGYHDWTGLSLGLMISRIASWFLPLSMMGLYLCFCIREVPETDWTGIPFGLMFSDDFIYIVTHRGFYQCIVIFLGRSENPRWL